MRRDPDNDSWTRECLRSADRLKYGRPHGRLGMKALMKHAARLILAGLAALFFVAHMAWMAKQTCGW